MRLPRYLSMALACILATTAMAQDLQIRIAECEACHGVGGASTDADVPSLSGMKVVEIEAAMEQFEFYERHCSTTTYRHGDRPKTPINMCNVANALSNEELAAIAEYFAEQ